MFSGIIYYFQYFPKELNEYQKISEFIIKKFEEKNIQVSIKKEGLNLGQENYLIDTQGFPVEMVNKNLLYIAKNSNYADFKDKDTLAILNDRELVLNLNNEYQNLPLESIAPNNQEIALNKNSVQNFINQNYLENNQLRNLLFGGFLLDRFFNVFVVFVWGYLIVGYLSYYLLKFSGFEFPKAICQSFSVLFAALFLSIQPIFYYLGNQLNLIYIFLFGFILVTLYLKKEAEKLSN
jgi:hypothetical protein